MERKSKKEDDNCKGSSLLESWGVRKYGMCCMPYDMCTLSPWVPFDEMFAMRSSLGEKERCEGEERWRGNGMFSILERLSLAHTPNANIIEKYIRFHLPLHVLSSPSLHIRANLALARQWFCLRYQLAVSFHKTSLCGANIPPSPWFTSSLFPSQLDYGWMFFYVDIQASESNRLEGLRSSLSSRLITWVITVCLTLSQRDLLTISSVCCVCFSRRLCFHLCPLFSPFHLFSLPFLHLKWDQEQWFFLPLLSSFLLLKEAERKRERERPNVVSFPSVPTLAYSFVSLCQSSFSTSTRGLWTTIETALENWTALHNLLAPSFFFDFCIFCSLYSLYSLSSALPASRDYIEAEERTGCYVQIVDWDLLPILFPLFRFFPFSSVVLVTIALLSFSLLHVDVHVSSP